MAAPKPITNSPAEHQREPAASTAPVTVTLRATAERLLRLRRERGLRLVDLAAITGLSEPHLYRIEQAERWPSLPTLLTLAAAFGVEPSTLLEGGPSAREPSTLHKAGATWEGSEDHGSGLMVNGRMSVAYDLQTRLTASDQRASSESNSFGSPEEMIGMAYAGCFSMSLAQRLGAAGFQPRRIKTSAELNLAATATEIAITEIHLTCNADVADIDNPRFQEIAHITKRSCVVSRALAAVTLTLDARLASGTASTKEEP